MTNFKVGDKVKLNPARKWYAANAMKASREGAVGEITKIDSSYATVAFEFGEASGITVKYGGDPFIPVDTLTNIEPRDDRAETIAYIKGKLNRAVKDHERAIEDEAQADRRKMAARARVDEFRAQLRALEVKSGDGFGVGDRVRVINGKSTFYQAVGTVTRDEGTRYEVSNLPRGNGTRTSGLLFAKSELELA